MINKYRKKPVVIEAVQWTGNNQDEICYFIGKTGGELFDENGALKIHTLEGIMTASINDYIIKGVDGEFYPCKSNIFKKTYEVY